MNLKTEELQGLLETRLPTPLAKALVAEFVQMRIDVVTGTLGRSSGGKFVETLVKALQYLDIGSFDSMPNVDGYLRNLDSSGASLDDGLKICASRVARSMYTLRNKRSIAHVGEVDPNAFDIAYLLHGAQWVLAELVRVVAGSSMKEGGRLIAEITAPVGGLVDDLGGQKVVVADLTAADEVLVLLHHEHPSPVSTASLKSAMKRRAGSTIRNAIKRLWRDKRIEGDHSAGYRLTSAGYAEANSVIAAQIGE